jgi:hypothetical protein
LSEDDMNQINSTANGRLRHREHGAASLVVTLALCAVLLLATLYANRGLMLEARMSAHQSHATVAFEAAEAGIEWAIAHLNDPRPIDAACHGGAGATTSFRERHVSMTPTPQGFAARTWNQAGVPVPLQAACVRADAGWTCHCPSDTAATLSEPSGTALAPAFRVQFEAGGQPGVLHVVSTGCTRLAGACQPGAGPAAEATARVQVSLTLLPALASAPAAALTARGTIATPAAIGLINPDPRSGGIAAHAGGVIDAAQARIELPAGSSSANALAGLDSHLARVDGAVLFVSLFGLSKDTWRRQSVVQRLTCVGVCDRELAQAIAAVAGPAQIWVDGDLSLDGPLALGSAERPVVIVATGEARLRGAVQLHGVLHANGMAWDQASAPAAWARGALVSEDGYTGDAAPDLVYDTAVLDTLRTSAGSFTRVPGSWRDF